MTRVGMGPALLSIGCALLLGYTLAACQQEDGLPDPPLRSLVPCVPDADAEDPLACPPPAPSDMIDLAIDAAIDASTDLAISPDMTADDM